MSEKLIKIMAQALDTADRLIERGYGDEVPKEWHKAYRAVQKARSSIASPAPKAEKPKRRPDVLDETEILRRLADGDTIVFSQDGELAWFTKDDRAYVGEEAIIHLRAMGFLSRRCDDEENYRGMSEYDTISDAGRAHLATVASPAPVSSR